MSCNEYYVTWLVPAKDDGDALSKVIKMCKGKPESKDWIKPDVSMHGHPCDEPPF